MTERSTKILRVGGTALLVLLNIAAIFLTVVFIPYAYDSALQCGYLISGMGCPGLNTVDWNIIIFSSLYLVTLSVSFAIALKKGHRAWWYNILILVLGPIALFLYLPLN